MTRPNPPEHPASWSLAPTRGRRGGHLQNHASYPAADIVIALAGALGADTRRLWRGFQLVEDLFEKDQAAVLRLIHSLASRREAPLDRLDVGDGDVAHLKKEKTP
jgi:hypothetical protein